MLSQSLKNLGSRPNIPAVSSSSTTSFNCWEWCSITGNIPLANSVQPSTCVPSQPTCWGGQSGKKRKPWSCSAISKMWVYYQCYLARNPKRSTIWAAVKKLHSVPDRPSTLAFCTPTVSHLTSILLVHHHPVKETLSKNLKNVIS